MAGGGLTPAAAWTRACNTWSGLADQDTPPDVMARMRRIRDGLERDVRLTLGEMYSETGAPRARTRRVEMRLVRELREARAICWALFSAFCRQRAAERAERMLVAAK